MNTSPSFGIWLKQQRIALDLTQAALASRIGCSVATIRKIEADERRPSRQIADLLANCLGIPAEERSVFLKVARGEMNIGRLERHDTTPTVRQPLPIAPTPLLGRETEVREITHLLQDQTCRLLTLVGPGGVGKTRLAWEVATLQQASFQDGTYFVSMASVASPGLIVTSLAEGMGISLSGSSDPQGELLNYLQHKQLLLVVDNMEHLLEGVAILTAVVHHAPRVKILVTSLERLNVQGEWTFMVQGLLAPVSDQVEALESYSAIDLFVRSARRASPDFALTAGNKAAVVRICQLMGGLPLGIELAAAWVRLLSCEELLQEIERSYDVPASTSRDIPERQRSLKAAFNHSWNLISESEKRALRHLSVFQGCFTREAAAQVAEVNLPLLASLLDKSLIYWVGDGRYTQHTLLRQYAIEHLQVNQRETELVRERYSKYYLTLLQKSANALTSDQQKTIVAELSADIDNIRACWDVAISQGRVDLLCRASWALFYFYELQNYFQEGEDAFRRGAEMVAVRLKRLEDEVPAEVRVGLEGALGELLSHQAFFKVRLGQMQEALESYQTSLSLLKSAGEPFNLAHALLHDGFVSWISGDLVRAKRSLEGGMLLKVPAHPWLEANYSLARGVVAHEQGDYWNAHQLLLKGVRIAQAAGDPHLISFSRSLYSRTAQVLRQTAETEELLEDDLALTRDTSDRWAAAMRLERMAVAAQAHGEREEARSLFDESVALFQQIGDHWSHARALNLRGYFALEIGDQTLARESFVEAGCAALSSQITPSALSALTGLATLAIQEGAYETAGELLQHVLQHPAVTYEVKKQAELLQGELALHVPQQSIAKVDRPFESLVAEVFQVHP